MLFGTTPTFLEKMGLDSLAQLPAIAEFVPGADVVEALEHGLRVEISDVPELSSDGGAEGGDGADDGSGRPALDDLLDGDTGA